MGVVHHICGEHEWLQGECNHVPLTSQEEGKTYLEKDSKAHQAVRDIVFVQLIIICVNQMTKITRTFVTSKWMYKLIKI